PHRIITARSRLAGGRLFTSPHQETSAMRLYLIRHADAAPLGEGGVADDRDRPLTELGHSQCQALAAALQKRDVKVDQIVTSPLLRARQTAEDVQQH